MRDEDAQFARLNRIVSDVQFNGWPILLRLDGQRPYLQVSDPNGVCNVTGKAKPWRGRKWGLSYHMTETEVVKTALKAVLAAVEHEVLELFKYRGVTIFDPHIRVEDLIELRTSCPLDGRG